MTESNTTPRLADVDLSQAVASRDRYQRKLKELQNRMSELAIACYHNRHRVVILFEGWDAGGKGGCIRRLVEKLDPRSFRVHPIAEPNALEKEEHYLQRFWRLLPANGNIAIFDRSWYGRVLVERVENFAGEAEWQRAYEEINCFERMLTDDGVVVIKLFLHISQEEQLRRYEGRLQDPLKNWKLTEDDLRNRRQAEDYRRAFDDMFRRTHREDAPWHLVAGNRKWFARLDVLATVIARLEASIDTRIPTLSPEEIARARKALGLA